MIRTYVGPILNGPWEGMRAKGISPQYMIGGIEHDPRPQPVVTPAPLGMLFWNEKRRGWDWRDREPFPIERYR